MFEQSYGGVEGDSASSAELYALLSALAVYLFCASEGLGSVFRGALDQAALAKILGLPEQQFVTFAQTVGQLRAS